VNSRSNSFAEANHVVPDDDEFMPDYEDDDDVDSETESLRVEHRQNKAAQPKKQTRYDRIQEQKQN